MNICFQKPHCRIPASAALHLIAAASLVLAGCDSGPNSKSISSTSKQSEIKGLNQVSAGGPSFRKVGPDSWRLTEKPAGSPAYWSAEYAAPGTRGKEFIGRINLSASSPVRASLSVMRAGSTPKEGSEVRVNLVPGQAKTFEVRHPFTQDHLRVKLQLAVVDGAPDTVLTIKDFGVEEAIKGSN
jgi:hypothetical protein